jgi:ABC-2 type transport system ATP-binding protein
MSGLKLSVQHLSYRYQATKALTDINFEATGPETLGLVGHNGSGKSTLLKILQGVHAAPTGHIKLNDQPAQDRHGLMLLSVRSSIGILFQDHSSDDKLSAKDNLTYAGYLHGLRGTRLKNCVEQTLAWAGLCERQSEPLKKYSQGMRRKLELYRTFMHEPRLVLLDEPTAGLDFHEVKKFYDFLSDYQKKFQALTILSSHHAQEADFWDTAMLLSQGKIIALGPVSQILKNCDYSRLDISLKSPQEIASFNALGFRFIKNPHPSHAGFSYTANLHQDELAQFLSTEHLLNKTSAVSINPLSIAEAYEIKQAGGHNHV